MFFFAIKGLLGLGYKFVQAFEGQVWIYEGLLRGQWRYMFTSVDLDY